MTNPKPNPDDNLGSFYMGRMRAPAPPRRVLPKGLFTSVMILSFAAIILYAYPWGQEKYSDLDIPVITASKEPYKFHPDDPGGMEVRHQDSTIFDPLDKGAAQRTEKLRPAPEEPLNKAQALKASRHAAAAASVNPGGKPESLKPAPQKLAAAAPVKAAVKTPAKAPVNSSAAQPVATNAKPATKPSAGGVYIQLGAYREDKGAKSEWAALQKKFPETLGKLDMHLDKADLGGKGTLTRLQAGRVPEARAKDICAALKSNGQPACFIVR